MKRLLYLATLSLVASMMFVPTALAQETSVPELCNQFTRDVGSPIGTIPSQEAAQEFFDNEATQEQQAILDQDGDGFACDIIANPEAGTDERGICGPGFTELTPELFENRLALAMDSPNPPQCSSIAGFQDTAPTTTAPTATTPTITEMPATGGPSLLVPASLLLLASGLLGLGVIRRK